jgi:hypothetical protein
VHRNYIRQNPVRQRLCEQAEEYPYSSAHFGFELDGVPQGLKPIALGAAVGAPEGAPFQSNVNQHNIDQHNIDQHNIDRDPGESRHDRARSGATRIAPVHTKKKIA